MLPYRHSVLLEFCLCSVPLSLPAMRKAPKADAMDAQHCRELALTLRQRNEVSESIRRGDLPKINNVAKAEILATHLETVCRALEFVEAECGRVTTLYLRKQPHHGSSMGDPQGRRLSLPTSLQPRRPARPGRFSLSPLPMIGMIVSQNFVSALESLVSSMHARKRPGEQLGAWFIV